MKRTILVLLLIAGSIQLKAQQLLQVKPGIKLNNGLQNNFKPNAFPSPKSLLLQQANKPAATNQINVTEYSTMPVAKVSDNDRMPVSAPRNNNISYTMPIIKVDIVNPLKPAQKPQP